MEYRVTFKIGNIRLNLIRYGPSATAAFDNAQLEAKHLNEKYKPLKVTVETITQVS